MATRNNIQRLQRGELSRINARKGRSTDVYIGPPGGTPQPQATDSNEAMQKLQTENARLQNEAKKAMTEAQVAVEQLKSAQTQVDNTQKKLQEQKQRIDELEKAAAEKPEAAPAEPVKGVRILSVEESNEADGLVRLDCKLKPTTGPLGETAAIIIPYDELDKVFDDGEDTPEEPSDDTKSEG